MNYQPGINQLLGLAAGISKLRKKDQDIKTSGKESNKTITSQKRKEAMISFWEKAEEKIEQKEMLKKHIETVVTPIFGAKGEILSSVVREVKS